MSGTCPRCRRQSLRDDPINGTRICANCGWVSAHSYIDETSEYRQFALEHGVKNKSRAAGMGDDMVESLGTSVQYDGSPRSKALAMQIRRMSVDPGVAKLKRHVKSIRTIAGQLDIERSVADRACMIYKEASEANITKTKKGIAVDGACLFHACNEKGLSKPDKVFLEFFGGKVTKKEFHTACEALRKLPSIENVEQTWENLVKNYTGPLRLPVWIEQAAVDVARTVREQGICEGKTHPGIIGGVLAYAVETCPDPSVKRTVDEISTAVGPKKDQGADASVQEAAVRCCDDGAHWIKICHLLIYKESQSRITSMCSSTYRSSAATSGADKDILTSNKKLVFFPSMAMKLSGAVALSANARGERGAVASATSMFFAFPRITRR